jgi:hypothetical protein
MNKNYFREHCSSLKLYFGLSNISTSVISKLSNIERHSLKKLNLLYLGKALKLNSIGILELHFSIF